MKLYRCWSATRLRAATLLVPIALIVGAAYSSETKDDIKYHVRVTAGSDQYASAADGAQLRSFVYFENSDIELPLTQLPKRNEIAYVKKRVDWGDPPIKFVKIQHDNGTGDEWQVGKIEYWITVNSGTGSSIVCEWGQDAYDDSWLKNGDYKTCPTEDL